MNFDEIQPNRELRAYARGQLNGVWGKMAFVSFILFLLYLPYYIFSTLDSINKFFYFLDWDTSDIIPSFPSIYYQCIDNSRAVVNRTFYFGICWLFLKKSSRRRNCDKKYF